MLVEAAIVTAIASLLIALFTAWRGGREALRAREAERELAASQLDAQRVLEISKAFWQEKLAILNDELARRAAADERRRTAKDELDRQAEPLLLAVIDLGHRINNVRNRCFLETYLDQKQGTARQDTALLGTMYRFAKYWAVVENLYSQVNILHFENDEMTRQVAACLKEIGATYAKDGLDGGKLMFWREEQRAVAELMLVGDSTVLGYASFAQQYHERFAPYLATFASVLRDGGLRNNERLRRLQDLYAQLAELLDTERLLERDWEWLPAETADKNRLPC